MPRRRKTHEEYLEELKLKNIPYIPLEPYIKSHNSIIHQCPEGHLWKATPANILNNRGCPGVR